MNNNQQQNCRIPPWAPSSTAQVVSNDCNPIRGPTDADPKCLITKHPYETFVFVPSFFPDTFSSKTSTMAFPFRQHPQHPRHVNHFAGHQHPRQVMPAPVLVDVIPPQVVYSRFELTYRDQFPDRKIPVDAFFAEVPIPGHSIPGYTYYECANDVVAYSKTVFSTTIPSRIKDDGILGVGMQAYENSVHLGCITNAIHGCCFGWGRRIGGHNGSVDNISALLDAEPDSPDKQQRLHVMNWLVRPLIVCIVKYVIPVGHQGVSLHQIMNCNVEHVRTQQTRRHRRCAFAQWTENWALHCDFLGVDRSSVQGHYYPFSCLMDRVIVGFFGRIHNPNFVLLGPPGRDINPTTDKNRRIHNDRFYTRRA